MPVISIGRVSSHAVLGLWKIEDSVETFFSGNPDFLFLRKKIVEFRSEKRRLEVLAVHALLYLMVGGDVVLTHSEQGCPHLSDGTYVSISHTDGCAAVIVSRQGRVSVDVEYIHDRVERVVGRLLRPDEKAVSLIEILLHWCAKETLYKLYSDDHLALTEMRLQNITGGNVEGNITVENLKRGETVILNYRIIDGYVMTYFAV